MARSNTTVVQTTTASLEDRVHDNFLDAGGYTGYYAHTGLKASLNAAKRSGSVTVAAATGFKTGFLLGWKSVK